MFRIEIRDEGRPVGKGWIQLGDFGEHFEMVFEYWSPAQYRQHWLEEISRVVDGAPVGALISSMTDPNTANFLFWWPMYRERDLVIFHNQMLLLSSLERPFRLAEHSASVSPRESISEDGDPISEWVVPVADLARFSSGART